MTRKHYVAIAAILKRRMELALNKKVPGYAVTQTKLIAEDFAEYFANDNPGFDRSRFLTACGVDA
jgi:hypothetical protein